MALTQEEVQRKILHFIFGTIIPVGIFYIPRLVPELAWLPEYIPAWLYPPVILAGFLVGFACVEFLRFRIPAVQSLFNKMAGSMLRKEEGTQITGATYINASALICAVIFKDRPHISFIVLAMFIWGDAIAALVGLSIGRIKIGKKSLEGSLGCLMVCLVMAFGVFPLVPNLLDVWGGKMPLAIGLAASFLITGLELIPMKITESFSINDNLAVPVLTGAVLIAINGAM